MLFSEDMFDVMRKRTELLRKPAVFAPASGTLNHQLPYRGLCHERALRSSRSRALIFTKAMKSAALISAS